MNIGGAQITFESEEGFRALVEHATVGILLVDKQGKIVFINPHAEKLFGYSKIELIGKQVEHLIPQSVRRRHESLRESYHEHPHPRQMASGLELSAQRKDGTQFPVEISLSNYKTESHQWVIAFINDISQRKKIEALQKEYAEKLEEAVKNRTAELSESLDKVLQLNETMSRFVSLASHEFRTPLSTILTSASLADRYEAPEHKEKRNKHLSRIKSSVRMMTNILEDFLSLDMLNRGKILLDLTTFDLTQVMEEVKEDLDSMLKPGQNIHIQADNSSNVTLDKKLVKNILINLTSNAIKYTQEHKNIFLSSSLDGRNILIKVADEGIGIPCKDQEHLFSMFFRGSNVSSIRGTGLGLNIVYKYVELMGGEISFESQENIGTTFTIAFPMNIKITH